MIRDIQSEDRELFIELADHFYHSSAVSHPVPRIHFERTFDLALAGSPYLRVFLFEEAGKVAGFSIVSLTYSNEAGGLTVLLEDIMVCSEFRGRGIGNQFLRFIEEEYPDAARFRLEVMAENQGAIRLYEKHGYEIITYRQMVKERHGSADSK